MGDFKINEKTVFTQSGGGEPAMGSTITGIPAAGITGTIPSGVVFPAGTIQNFVCSTPAYTSDTSTFLQEPTATATDTVLLGSSVAYTPTVGSRFVVYIYTFNWRGRDSRAIFNTQCQLDSVGFFERRHGQDTSSGVTNDYSSSTTVTTVIDLSTITDTFPTHSSHSWQTNSGTTSHSPSAGTLRMLIENYSSSYKVWVHAVANTKAGVDAYPAPTTIIYSVM